MFQPIGYHPDIKELISMIKVTDKCYLFNNSGKEFRLIAQVGNNTLTLSVDPNNFQTG